jgi:hypothetical protein
MLPKNLSRLRIPWDYVKVSPSILCCLPPDLILLDVSSWHHKKKISVANLAMAPVGIQAALREKHVIRE